MKLYYFKLFYRLLGVNLIFTLLLSIMVSILDSIGIGFFISIAQYIFDTPASQTSYVNNSITHSLSRMGIQIDSVRQLFIIGLVAFIVKSILFYFLQILHAKNTTGMIRDQRITLITKLERVSYIAFTDMDFGRIHNVCTTEITKMNNALRYFLAGSQYLTMAIVYLLISFTVNYQISLIILIFAAIFLLFYSPVKKYFSRLSDKVSLAGNNYNSLLTQILNNFKYLKATNSFPILSEKIKKYIDDAETSNFNILKGSTLSGSLREPILLILLSLILIIYSAINHTISLLALLSLALFYRTLNFIILAQNNLQQFNSYKASLENVLQLESELEQNKELDLAGKVFTFSQNFHLQKISLKLKDKLILNDINLNVPKNKTIGIVGQSGAGKTTLINVLNGLIPPTTGKLRIDDTEVSSFSLSNFRSQIGYVSQDPVIFNDSLFNNVTLWAEKNRENLKKFQNAIYIALLDQLMRSYPMKEDTILGEKGVILSGGQKQRVAIARELYKNVEIIILDEATSSLDSNTENQIKENIDALQGTYTLIIIAHRLSTIKNANHIYVVENGTVVAGGNYTELLANSPEFRKLIHQQREQ